MSLHDIIFALTIKVKSNIKIFKSKKNMEAVSKAITPQAIKMLKQNLRARNLICLEQNTTINTVNRWIENGNDILTKEKILQIIEKETGLKRKQILVS